jgi:hypothetical protein
VTDLSPALIERFIVDLDREIAEHRAHVRARKNVRRFLRKLLRSTRRGETTSTAPAEKLLNPEPPQAKRVAEASTEPMGAGGAQDGLPVRPATNPGDTSGTMSDVSAAMTSLLEGEQGTTQREHVPSQREGQSSSEPPEQQRDTLGVTGGESAASKSHATGKPGAASSDKAAPAPSIVSRLRALNAEHPEFTVRQAANQLGLDVEKVRTNSYVNKIKWAHSSHFARRLGGEVAADAVERRAEANEAFDEPSPAPEPKRAPAVKSEPAIDAPRIPRPLSGSKFHLVNDKGEYLNRFCAGFTTDRRTAWIGTEQQLAACRRNFDIARDLTERPVGKELPPVPVNREVA